MTCRDCIHKVSEKGDLYNVCELTSTLISKKENFNCLYHNIDMTDKEICLNCRYYDKSSRKCTENHKKGTKNLTLTGGCKHFLR